MRPNTANLAAANGTTTLSDATQPRLTGPIPAGKSAHAHSSAEN
jgi:hypothetical protein